MALAKAGMKIVEAPAVMTVPQVRQFLGLAPFKVIYFDPVSESQDCLLQLRKSIPEFFDCKCTNILMHCFIKTDRAVVDDDTHGQLFHSKYFPTLRYFIQTGFDQECGILYLYFDNLTYRAYTHFFFQCQGCLNYKRMFLPNPSDNFVNQVAGLSSDNDPLYMKATIGTNGSVSAGEWQTHNEVKQNNSWRFEKNLREKTYFEV